MRKGVTYMLMQYIPVPPIDYVAMNLNQNNKNHVKGYRPDANKDFIKFNFEPLNNKVK